MATKYKRVKGGAAVQRDGGPRVEPGYLVINDRGKIVGYVWTEGRLLWFGRDMSANGFGKREIHRNSRETAARALLALADGGVK